MTSFSFRVDGGFRLRQPVLAGKVFGELYINESRTPAYNGYGTTDEDVDAMEFAPPFNDIMKDYLKIGKKKRSML